MSNSPLLLLFQRYIPPYIPLYVRKSGRCIIRKKRIFKFDSPLCPCFYFNDTFLHIFLYTSEKDGLFEKRGSSLNSILLFGLLLFQRYIPPYIPLYVRKSGRWIIRKKRIFVKFDSPASISTIHSSIFLYTSEKVEGGLFEKRGSSSISNSILLFGSISTTHSSVYSFIRPKKWKVNYSKKENLRQIRFSSFVLFQRHIPPYISLYVRKSGLFEKRESSSNSILLLLFQRYTPLYFFIRPKKWKVDYSREDKGCRGGFDVINRRHARSTPRYPRDDWSR